MRAHLPHRSGLLIVACAAVLCGLPPLSRSQPPDLRTRIEDAARKALTESGAPSASIAVVRDGRIVFVGAYGDARLDPRLPAGPQMHYSIGSISKQVTAAAILLLMEEGKLSLDDKVSRFLPTLTRANEVTIRQVLSHTSGYQDYWPQDYVMPPMLLPVSPDGILERWARKQLDFDPGTRWQYSNTNFVIAGLLVEKASGAPFMRFLRERIFTPLGMKSVADVDQGPLPNTDPTGYIRHALGPLRPAPKLGSGWLFAAGQLAMTAEDLARWDLSLIERRLLKPASHAELTTEVLLKNGAGTRYGLGIGVSLDGERRLLEHEGEVSGFTAENMVFPEDRAAIVVLTNQDATRAAGEIAGKIKPLLFADDDATTMRARERDGKIFAGLQRGTLDRSLFTENANS